jgi:hypothetical protein
MQCGPSRPSLQSYARGIDLARLPDAAIRSQKYAAEAVLCGQHLRLGFEVKEPAQIG